MARIAPLIAIGLPTWGKVSTRWARGYRHLGGPLGSTMIEFEVRDAPIAEARNTLMQHAIDNGADYLFMIGDDVIPPGDAVTKLLQRCWDHPEVDLVTGVYWTKAWPTQPYLWRGMQRGPYMDWRAGEWFPVDFAGCDCLLIRLSARVKALGPAWFSTTWYWEPEQGAPSNMATEDFHFYTKAREAGVSLWCDSGVQCLHEDRQSGLCWGLVEEMPQAGLNITLPELPEPGSDAPFVMAADLGCGDDTPWFGSAERVKVVRFDADEKWQPDYRCDLRHLPVQDGVFDIVHSRHVLEHFGRAETLTVLREWGRVLRNGGQFRLMVPNLLWAARQIVEIEDGTSPLEGEIRRYPWLQLYGEQSDQFDLHQNGFTPKRLQAALEACGCFSDVVVEEQNGGINLVATAVKVELPPPYALTTAWYRIEQAEGIGPMPGLRREDEFAAVTEPIAPAPQYGHGLPETNGHAPPEQVTALVGGG